MERRKRAREPRRQIHDCDDIAGQIGDRLGVYIRIDHR